MVLINNDEILYDEDDEIFKFNSINQITASFDGTGNNHGMLMTTTSGGVSTISKYTEWWWYS